MKKYQSHPLAELFPMFGTQELKDLAADIKENGVEVPALIFEGKILDGRNRAAACEIAGVKLPTVEYKGKDPLGHVLSLNLHRRHLTTSQRAMIAAKLAKGANLPQDEHPTQAAAAETLHVSERSVKTASAILDRGKAKDVRAVESGTKTVNEVATHLPSKPAPAKSNLKPDEKTVAAITKIEKVLGKQTASALKTGTIDLPGAEIQLLAKQNDAKMREIEPLIIENRWTTTKALKFLSKMITEETTIAELMNYAIATKSGYTEVQIGKFKITCRKQ